MREELGDGVVRLHVSLVFLFCSCRDTCLRCRAYFSGCVPRPGSWTTILLAGSTTAGQVLQRRIRNRRALTEKKTECAQHRKIHRLVPTRFICLPFPSVFFHSP